MNTSEGGSASSFIILHRNASRFPSFCRSLSEVNGLVAIYIVLIIIVVMSNSIIMITFVRNKKVRTVTNFFFASLAVSDFLVGALSIPMWVHILVSPLHNNCRYPPRSFLEVYKFLDIFSALSSTAHLMAISFERSLAITRPLRHRTLPRNFFYALLGVAWFYGLLSSVLIVLDLSELWVKYRAIAVFVAGFCFPLVAIVILYTMTYRSVKSYVRRRQSNTTIGFNKYLLKEKRTAKTVGIILGVFILAWLPFFTVSLVVQFCPFCRGNLSLYIVDFVKILHYTNSAVNPFIYTFRSAAWKTAVLRAILPCVDLGDGNALQNGQSSVSERRRRFKTTQSTSLCGEGKRSRSTSTNESEKQQNLCKVPLFRVKKAGFSV